MSKKGDAAANELRIRLDRILAALRKSQYVSLMKPKEELTAEEYKTFSEVVGGSSETELSVIQDKVANGAYTGVEDFTADVRTAIDNAAKYYAHLEKKPGTSAEDKANAERNGKLVKKLDEDFKEALQKEPRGKGHKADESAVVPVGDITPSKRKRGQGDDDERSAKKARTTRAAKKGGVPTRSRKTTGEEESFDDEELEELEESVSSSVAPIPLPPMAPIIPGPPALAPSPVMLPKPDGMDVSAYTQHTPGIPMMASPLMTELPSPSDNSRRKKPIACDFPGCTFVCDVRTALNKHRYVHRAEMPYACPAPGCSYRASKTSHVHLHQAAAHRADALQLRIAQLEAQVYQRDQLLLAHGIPIPPPPPSTPTKTAVAVPAPAPSPEVPSPTATRPMDLSHHAGYSIAPQMYVPPGRGAPTAASHLVMLPDAYPTSHLMARAPVIPGPPLIPTPPLLPGAPVMAPSPTGPR